MESIKKYIRLSYAHMCARACVSMCFLNVSIEVSKLSHSIHRVTKSNAISKSLIIFARNNIVLVNVAKSNQNE